MHSVKTLMELPYMAFLAGVCKPRRLLHILPFLFRENPVKESSLHIILFNVPVANGSDVEGNV